MIKYYQHKKLNTNKERAKKYVAVVYNEGENRFI